MNCTYGNFYEMLNTVNNLPLNILYISETIISILTIPLVGYNAKTLYSKKSILHKNFLIISMGLLAFYFIYCVVIFAMHTTRQIEYRIYSNICDMFMTSFRCVMFRGIEYTCIVGFSMAHFCMSIERTLATHFSKKYENLRNKTGIYLLFMMYILSFLIVLFALSPQDAWFIHDQSVCTGIGATGSTAATRWGICHYVFLVIDFSATGMDWILLWMNHKKKVRINSKSYNLSQNYQIVENQSTIRGMISFSSVHTVAFTCYLVYALVLRILVDRGYVESFDMKKTLYEGGYMLISVYILVIMIVLYFIPLGKRKHQPIIVIKTQEAHIYFKYFDAQLNLTR